MPKAATIAATAVAATSRRKKRKSPLPSQATGRPAIGPAECIAEINVILPLAVFLAGRRAALWSDPFNKSRQWSGSCLTTQGGAARRPFLVRRLRGRDPLQSSASDQSYDGHKYEGSQQC